MDNHSKHDGCAFPDEPCNQLTFAAAMAMDPSDVEYKPDGGYWKPLAQGEASPLHHLRLCSFRRARPKRPQATVPAGDFIAEAIDRAVKRFGDQGDGLFNAAGFSNAFMHLAGVGGVLDGNIVRAILSGRIDVKQEHDASHFRRVKVTTIPPALKRSRVQEMAEKFGGKALYVAGIEDAIRAVCEWLRSVRNIHPFDAAREIEREFLEPR